MATIQANSPQAETECIDLLARFTHANLTIERRFAVRTE
ncbi:MAG: hypothetical protein ACI9QL_004965, partial [Candidatus Omnitrophota bacterium]